MEGSERLMVPTRQGGERAKRFGCTHTNQRRAEPCQSGPSRLSTLSLAQVSIGAALGYCMQLARASLSVLTDTVPGLQLCRAFGLYARLEPQPAKCTRPVDSIHASPPHSAETGTNSHTTLLRIP